MKTLYLSFLSIIVLSINSLGINVPNLYAPSNGASYQDIAETLDWYSVSNNEGYRYQVDVTPNFNSPNLIDGTTNNSHTTVSNLHFGTTYYWRVMTLKSSGNSAWSSVWSFTTRSTVVNVSPQNGALYQDIAEVLDWSSIVGNAGYMYQLDTNPNFNSPLFVQGNTVSTSAVTVSNLLFGTTYYWRACAKGVNDTSEWSTPFSFTTKSTIVNVSPQNGALYQDIAEVLDWSSVDGNAGYMYQLDTNPNFDSPLFVQGNTVSTSAVTVSNLLFGTTYYWRACAKGVNDTSEWSAPFSFTTKSTIVNVSPQNGALYQDIAEVLDWSSVDGNVGYMYQLDTNPNFDSPLFVQGNTVSTSAVTVSNLLFGTTYYWRACAKGVNDTSEWSTPFSFTTKSTIVNVSPQNGALYQDIAEVLDWSSVDGNVGYMYQLDTNPNFDSPLFVQGNTVSTSAVTVSNLLFGTTYYWRACAKGVNDTSEWSIPFSFTTKYTVNNISPSNNATNIAVDVNLDWSSISYNAGYLCQIDTSPNFNSALFQQLNTPVNSSEKNVSGLLYGTRYYWRAACKSSTDTSAFSDTWSFKTGYELLEVPTLVSPTDLSSNLPYTSVGLEWTSITDANFYQYQYSTDNTFATGVHTATSVLTTANISELDANTTYYWRVRGGNNAGFSNWSTVWSFTTENIVLDVPVLVTPSNNSQDLDFNSINLEWNSVNEATQYTYQVSTDNTFASDVESETVNTTNKTLTNLAINTQYFWRVKASNDATESAWSEVWSFTTENVVLDVPVLVAPTNNSQELDFNNINLEWNSVNEATQYTYQISTDNTFASDVESETVSSTDQTLTNLAINTQYFWRVKASNDVTESAWSEVWNFTTENVVLDVPVLVAPTNNSQELDFNSINLEWNSVNEATQYTYQVSTDNTFTSDVESETVSTTNQTLTNFSANTQYFWRVKASNNVTESAWSEVWSFTTESISLESPQLLFPLNNSENLDVGIISIEWLFVMDATEYTCQISTDNTFTSDVVSETTTSTYKELTDLATNTECFWRVKASNPSGESDWSQTWRFSTFGFVGVPNLEDDSATKVYPNPSNGIFTLEGDGINAIEIVNSKGQIVSKRLIDKNITLIDVSNLPKGMYFLKVFNNKGVIYTKIVKQ